MQIIKAKYQGTCAGGCGEEIVVGEDIGWYGGGEVYHKDCLPERDRPKEDPAAFANLFHRDSCECMHCDWSS